MSRLLIIGGSDAGISAALRAGEVDPSVEVTVVVEDSYPNYSICGLPYYLSAGISVDDLNDLDLSYAPPFGSPWEAVQLAAQEWVNESRQESASVA